MSTDIYLKNLLKEPHVHCEDEFIRSALYWSLKTNLYLISGDLNAAKESSICFFNHLLIHCSEFEDAFNR